MAKYPVYTEEEMQRVRRAMGVGDTSKDGRTEGQKELDEALYRVRVELVGAVGDVIKALTPVFSEANKVIQALVKISREKK